MIEATNVQVLKGADAGSVEFSKRYGTTSIPATDTGSVGMTNPLHLVTLGLQLVQDNAQGVFVRDTSQNAYVTHSRQGYNFSSDTDVISQSLYQKVAPSHAYDTASGNEIIAWYDEQDGLRFSVRGRDFFDWSAHETNVPTAAAYVFTYKTQSFAPGDGFFYIFAPKVAATSLAVVRVIANNPSAAPTIFTLNFDPTSSPFDVQQNPEGKFVIAIRNVGATSTTVGVWNPATQSFITSSSTATLGLFNAMWLSQNPFGTPRRYYLVIGDATNGISLLTFDSTSVLLSNVVLDATVTDVASNFVGWVNSVGVMTLFHDHKVPGFYKILQTTGGTSNRWIGSINFASRAFLVNGAWHAMARFDSLLQPELYLVALATKQIVGKVGVGGPLWQNYASTATGVIPWVTQIGTKAIIAAMAGHTAVNQTAATPVGTQVQGIDLVTFDSSPALSKPAELGGVLHYPGSIPWIFDGANAIESGFNVFPEAARVNGTAGSGPSKTIGATYGYRVTYIKQDAVGNVYESAPSPIFFFVATSTNDINIEVPTDNLTSDTTISLNVYRNDPTSPTVFKLVNSAIVPNVTTADTVTIVDSLKDNAYFPAVGSSLPLTDWGTRPALYAGDGGAGQPVEHIPPPPCTLIATAQNRIFLAGVDQDPTAVWFSNEYVTGEQSGVSYFDGFIFRVTGAVTAIVGRDRNIVVFTADSIWTVTGEFPDASFGSFQIPTPFKLPHALGAISQNAVVVSTAGIFFQSSKGLHLLGWDWSVKYIGGDIEDTLGTEAITAGLDVPELHQVRLYTASGNTFVWDTEFSCWTLFDNQPARSACNWSGVPCYVGADGIVHKETPGIFGDDGVFVSSTLLFAIIAPAGMRGYFCLLELQLLGEIRGDHTLNASLGYNSEAFPTTTYTANEVSGVYGSVDFGTGVYGATDGVLRLEIRPKKRQSAAYQLKLWDTQLTTGTSGGFTLQAIASLIGIEDGLYRAEPAQRMLKV
jgi:hypothetical protein